MLHFREVANLSLQIEAVINTKPLQGMLVGAQSTTMCCATCFGFLCSILIGSPSLTFALLLSGIGIHKLIKVNHK